MTTPSTQSVPPCVCGKPECDILFGYCHCGCGNKTTLIEFSHTRRGRVKGKPNKYVMGHSWIKPAAVIPSNITCLCGSPTCKIPHGYCHCGCGNKTDTIKTSSPSYGLYKGEYRLYIHQHQGYKRVPIEKAIPFKIDGAYCRLIPLSRGQHTIVWESDYEWLMQWRWQADFDEDTQGYYATRSSLKHESNTRIRVSMHCQILGLTKGSSLKGDHINGLTIDNRRSNLRPVTDEQSVRNRGINKNNTSGYKGVYRMKDSEKCRAYIRAEGRQIDLGMFANFDLACSARKEAEVMYHGEYARKLFYSSTRVQQSW